MRRLNSDWLADQWDEPSVLRHTQISKVRMKGDDTEVGTALTLKCFNW